MKLIDMLVVDGLNGWQWPDGVKCITQDNGSSTYKGVAFGYCKEPYLKKNIWLAANGTGHADVKVKKYDVIADDWATAIITREQYEAALAAKNDGWIEWGGGECPVPCGTAVDVKHRCGAVSENQQAWPKHHKESDVVVNPFSNAGQAFWRHENSVVDIIAYRLHKPQEATEADCEADLNECIGQDAAPVWGGEGKPAIGEKCEHHSGGQWEAVTIAGIYENLVTGFTDYWMVKEDGSSYTVGNPYRFRPIRSEADRKRDAAVGKIFDVICKSLTDESESTSFAIYDAIAAGEIPGVRLED